MHLENGVENGQCTVLIIFEFKCSGLAVYSLTRALKLLSTSEKIKAFVTIPCQESATLLRRYIFLVYT